MTTEEAWRWVAHHWAYGMLRLTVIYIDSGVALASTAVRAARGLRRDSGSIPDDSTMTSRLLAGARPVGLPGYVEARLPGFTCPRAVNAGALNSTGDNARTGCNRSGGAACQRCLSPIPETSRGLQG